MADFAKLSSNENKLSIPAIIRIGVTGHRTFSNEHLIHDSIKKALTNLDKKLDYVPHTFSAISPLAEGADRLVANIILDWPVSEDKNISNLEVILPLPENEYLNDFETEVSKEEFRVLINRAISTQVFDQALSRHESYLKAGQYVVQNCDVLIAVWDGKPSEGLGGTAEIVEYARDVDRYIIWINSKNGEIIEEGEFDDHFIRYIENLKIYNNEKLSDNELSSASDTLFSNLEKHAYSASLPHEVLDPLRENLIPQFVRSDILAQRYQDRFMKVGSAIYSLAALAIATVTIQTLFFTHLTELLWFEVIEIALILLLLWASHKGDWHRKWIDYRFLAERLRSAIFLDVAGIETKPPKIPIYLSLNLFHRPDDWIIRGFSWIWNIKPKVSLDLDIHFESIKDFLLLAWIGDQISWYKINSIWHRSRHTWYSRIGFILFSITFFAAVIHATDFGHFFLPPSFNLPDLLVALVIILPAVGASLAGIRVHREHLRNAERYDQIASHLLIISEQIGQVSDMKTFTSLLEEANETMLRENKDWRVVFLFQKLETP